MKGRWISLELSEALFDTNLGYTAFTVQRTTYNRQNGTSVPSTKTMSAAGAIHPGTPEMLQLLPAEERHEEFIAIYTDFPLSLGENPGGETCTTPDRITWQGETWRVVKVKSWSAFSYCQCLAVKVDHSDQVQVIQKESDHTGTVLLWSDRRMQPSVCASVEN